MVPSAATPALKAWLAEQVARGCTWASLMQSMLDSGWAMPVATEALMQATAPLKPRSLAPSALAVAERLPGGAVPLAGAPALPDLREPGLHQLKVANHEVRVILDLANPRVVVVADLLTPGECADLMAAASGRLQRSQTVSALGASTAEVNAARTSEGMFFLAGEHEVVARLEQRIAALFNWPLDQAEGLQVLRYRPGAQYRPHFDHFDTSAAGGLAAVARGGQRVGTVVVYLATPDAGGATVFPDLGLKVHAHAGHAVFFNYDVTSGGAGVLHGGEEVSAGEKWVATKWLREKKFE